MLTSSDVLLAKIFTINNINKLFAALTFIRTFKSKVENTLMLNYTKKFELPRFVSFQTLGTEVSTLNYKSILTGLLEVACETNTGVCENKFFFKLIYGYKNFFTFSVPLDFNFSIFFAQSLFAAYLENK